MDVNNGFRYPRQTSVFRGQPEGMVSPIKYAMACVANTFGECGCVVVVVVVVGSSCFSKANNSLKRVMFVSDMERFGNMIGNSANRAW